MIIYIGNWDGVKVEIKIDIRIKEKDNIMVKIKISMNRLIIITWKPMIFDIYK